MQDTMKVTFIHFERERREEEEEDDAVEEEEEEREDKEDSDEQGEEDEEEERDEKALDSVSNPITGCTKEMALVMPRRQKEMKKRRQKT